MAITALVLALLMVFGLLMRASQAGLLIIPPDRFYQVLTAHGIGMVAICGLGGAGVMLHFLSRYVTLTPGIILANLVFFLLGVVLVLGGIFIGGFAAAWTFLFPLPAQSQNTWGPGATASYLVGVLLVGVGFLLLFLDTTRAIVKRYGSLGKALGWPQAFGKSTDEPPPPTVVVSTVVSIINILSIAVGAVILTMSLVNTLAPSFQVNALLAKNLIFFFGHVFINSTIYMAVIGVYEILPTFTGRPWKSSKPFLMAWTATMVMVLGVYPHHLFMDFANPRWANILGQVLSYTSSLPVLAVTAVGTLANVHRSGMKWNMASGAALRGRHGLDRWRRPGRRRRHHRDQPCHAQHDVGAGPLPHLPAARSRGNAVRLHVPPRHVIGGCGGGQCARSRQLLDVRRGWPCVLGDVPGVRGAQHPAPVGGPPRAMDGVRPPGDGVRAGRRHRCRGVRDEVPRPRAQARCLTNVAAHRPRLARGLPGGRCGALAWH